MTKAKTIKKTTAAKKQTKTTRENAQKVVKVQRVQVAKNKNKAPEVEMVSLFGYEMEAAKFEKYAKYGIAAAIVLVLLAIVF
jgi:hypothetical protein